MLVIADSAKPQISYEVDGNVALALVERINRNKKVPIASLWAKLSPLVDYNSVTSPIQPEQRGKDE